MDWSSVLRIVGVVWTGLLVLLLWWAARPRRGPWWRWLPSTLACVTVAAFLWLLNRWDLSSVYLRPLYPALFALACAFGLWRRRVDAKPSRRPRVRAALAVSGAVLNVVVVVILAPSVIDALRGYATPDGAIELRSPLRDGHFVVGQGGGSEATNHHATVSAQRYALDIVAVNRIGFGQRLRRRGSLDDYVAFGKPVVAPCGGTVRVARDDLEDRLEPAPGAGDLAGNHVVLDCGDVLVLLAHLRSGSVAAAVGEGLRAGDPIGEIGNSGNTTEPHLHLHVVRDPSPDDAVPAEPVDTLGSDRVAVPFTIDGRFLVRGSRVPDSW